jgi:hypothetical protein
VEAVTISRGSRARRQGKIADRADYDLVPRDYRLIPMIMRPIRATVAVALGIRDVARPISVLCAALAGLFRAT